MIVDTSAIMAILLDEADARAFSDALSDAGIRRISAGTWIELSAVITRRHDVDILHSLNRLMSFLKVEVMPVSVSQATIGHDAYRRFGRGSGHPARLNFGDCFAYALAKDSGAPLLFKGDDFVHTDVTPAST